MSVPNKNSIAAVILAGGQARRMGGQDKGLLTIANKPMISYVIEAIRDQVGSLLINANRNQQRYAEYGFPVIEDSIQGFHGPLAGVASALQVVEQEYLLCLPCDSPYVPSDLVARLSEQLVEQQADISVAHNGERLQPVFSLIKTSLQNSLLDYLDSGERKIDRWFGQHKMVTADFSDKPETFINVNSPDDIKNIENQLNSTSS